MELNIKISEMESLFNGFKAEVDQIRKMLSEVDNEVNRLYHEIEVGNFNASAGFKKMKELQEALRRRRVIKNELIKINQLDQKIKLNDIVNNLNKAKSLISKQIIKQETYVDGWNVKFHDLIK